MKISNKRKLAYLKWAQEITVKLHNPMARNIGLQISQELIDLVTELEKQGISINNHIELLRQQRCNPSAQQTKLPLK